MGMGAAILGQLLHHHFGDLLARLGCFAEANDDGGNGGEVHGLGGWGGGVVLGEDQADAHREADDGGV